MSNIRLESSSELVTFLKLLAEESISSAKSEIKDDAQANIRSGMKRDAEIYKHITEQDSEMQNLQGELDKDLAGTKPDSQNQPQSMEPAPERLEVSLDSITDSIKQLRSGRSVDDSRIRDEMRTYYDRINETEKQALLAFMRAFSGILTGDLDGASAPDPSDEPYNVSMTSSGEESPEAAPEPQQPAAAAEPEAEEEDDDLEDTSPPVKVGEPQALAEIRRKIKKLMISE